MKRMTHLFLLAVDSDPIPGGMDFSRIANDVKHIVENAFIDAYNPKVVPLDALVRESNFKVEVTVDLGVSVARMHKDDITEFIYVAPVEMVYEKEDQS